MNDGMIALHGILDVCTKKYDCHVGGTMFAFCECGRVIYDENQINEVVSKNTWKKCSYDLMTDIGHIINLYHERPNLLMKALRVHHFVELRHFAEMKEHINETVFRQSMIAKEIVSLAKNHEHSI